MAIRDSPLELQAMSCESEGSNTDSDLDDSEEDPDYDMLEETYSNFSNLSLKNKAKSRVVEGKGKDPEVLEMTAPSIPEENFEKVKKMIKDGLLEKLKVDECKLYLRNNGLRLTGNKDTLIQRIREHLEIVNGGGERKYPPSSFVLNCKGDACTGDVVLFEQNVYEMFNIASRSAGGPPCGKRIVAGRIVKESYGAAKQQHTFTIEVLWSKGEKPFPPLHPLLIKGRNLYRLKTLRQKWEDEGERQKMLMEKHSRGFVAREDREARIQEKQRRKTLRENRVSKKDSERNRCQSQSHMTISQCQSQETNISILPEKPTFPYQNSSLCGNSRKETSAIVNKPAAITEQVGEPLDSERVAMGGYTDSGKTSFPVDHIHNQHQQAWKRSADFRSTFVHDRFSRAGLSAGYNWPDFHCRENPTITEKYYPHHRKPLESATHFILLMPNGESCKQKQPCRHYARGRCYFGDNCKFLHDLGENVYKGNA